MPRQTHYSNKVRKIGTTRKEKYHWGDYKEEVDVEKQWIAA